MVACIEHLLCLLLELLPLPSAMSKCLVHTQCAIKFGARVSLWGSFFPSSPVKTLVFPYWHPQCLPLYWSLVLCLQTSTSLSLKKKIRWPNCPFILLSYYLSPSFPCQAVSICCLYCFIIHLPLRLLPSAFPPTTLLFHSPKYALFKVNVDWFFSCFSRSSSNCFYNNNHLFIFFLLSLLIT